MFKRLLNIIFIVLLIFISTIQPINAFDVESEVVLLYDLDQDCMVYSKNEKEKRQVASLTKLLAILVAIEEIEDLSQKITVYWDDIQGYYDYSKVGFSQGDEVSYMDLLYGMMLPSGADAALLITKHVAGSEEKFAKLMNEKAKELGMYDSCFDNAVGSDSDQNYSTAYDLMKLINYALKNPVFLKLFTAKSYKIEHLNIEMETTVDYYTRDTNIDIDFILGSKTGYTDEAGRCLASLVSHEGNRFVLITLGGAEDDVVSAIRDSSEVYDEFTQNYHKTEVIKKDEHIISLPIEFAWKDYYEIDMPESIYRFIDNENNIYIQYRGIQEINRDIKKGDYLGCIEIYQNNHVVLNYPIYLDKFIIYHYPLIYIIITLILLLFAIRYRNIKRRKRRRRYKK